MNAPRGRATPFAIPLRRPLAAGGRTITVRHGLLIELRDANGHLGFGEAAPLPAAAAPDWRRQPALRAALEAAFLDLEARVAGLPLYRHLVGPDLGGSCDGSVAVNALLDGGDCASGGRRPGGACCNELALPQASGADAAAPSRPCVAAQARAFVAAGFRCLKLKLDVGDADGAVRRVAAVRAAVGPTVALRADGNAAWSLTDAVALLRALAPFDLEYVEQPVATIDELAALRQAVSVPLAADESVSDAAAVARIAGRGAADVIVLKPALLGLRQSLAAAAVARDAGLAVVITSTLDSGVGIAAAAHLAAALGIDRPCGLATAALLAGDLADPSPAILGGVLRLRDAPGLGVDLDREALERWRSGPTRALSELLATRPAAGERPRAAGCDPLTLSLSLRERGPSVAARSSPRPLSRRERDRVRESDSPAASASTWLEHRAATHGAHTALVCGDRRLDFSTLAGRAADVAARLRGLGVGRGDRVALLVGARLEFAELLHGITRLGAVAVPLGPRLTAVEVGTMLAACRCTALLYDRETAATAAALPIGLVAKRAALDGAPIAGDQCLEALPAAARRHATWPALDAPHSVVFTSGSSGAPRPVTLSAGNHLWSALASATVLGVRDDDRWLACLPLHHVGGLSILMRSLVLGMPVELHERFDPARVNAAVDAGATLVSLVAAMLQRVLEARGARPFPPHLRAVLLGGGAAPRALLEECARRGVPLAPTYGMTECASQIATRAPGDADADGDADGARGDGVWPLPGVSLRLAGAAAAGDVGEIQVRGPIVSRAAAGRDGWLRTRDLGAFDAAGRLVVVGRADDVIISGGENVHPREVERALESHPCVAEACAFGLPDADWGEVVAAEVCLKRGSDIDVETLRQHARRALAGFKLPRRLAVVADFPRSAAGKIQRRAVRAAALDDAESGPAVAASRPRP